MSLVAAVDPGLRECGWCLVAVDGGKVIAGGLSRNPKEEGRNADVWEAMAFAVAQDLRDALNAAGYVGNADLLAVERQWIGGPRERSEDNEAGGTRNPSAIVTLAHVVGAIILAVPAHRKVAPLPSQWKGGSTRGGAKKERVNALVWASLTEVEKAAASDATQYNGHNVKDAIGIARWAWANYRRLIRSGLP